MERYQNLGGNSGVLAYSISVDSKTVQFKEGRYKKYLYTYNSAGKTIIEHMKSLAVSGRGLNSYISTTVKSKFESKY